MTEKTKLEAAQSEVKKDISGMEKRLKSQKSSFSCSLMPEEAAVGLEWRVTSPIFAEEEMKIPLPSPSKIPGWRREIERGLE